MKKGVLNTIVTYLSSLSIRPSLGARGEEILGNIYIYLQLICTVSVNELTCLRFSSGRYLVFFLSPVDSRSC